MMIALILATISLCVSVFSFFFFRRYIARKTAAREILADYRAEVYRLIAEIDTATDRDSLLVEERIKTLKQIIDDTDRRVSVYMRESRRSRDAQTMYNNLGRGIRAALDSRPSLTEEQVPQLELGLQETPQAAAIPRKTADAKASRRGAKAAAETPSAKKRAPKKTKLKERIAELSAKGIPPQKIASRLKISLAEVDLALNLLNRPPEKQHGAVREVWAAPF